MKLEYLEHIMRHTLSQLTWQVKPEESELREREFVKGNAGSETQDMLFVLQQHRIIQSGCQHVRITVVVLDHEDRT